MNALASPRGVFQATLAMSLVGSLTAVSAVINDYPLFGGQAARYAMAAVVLYAVIGIRGRFRPEGDHRPRERIRQPGRPGRPGRPALLGRLVLLSATGLVAFNACVVAATAHIGPTAVGIVLSGSPVVLALAGPVQQRRRPSAAVVAGALIVAFGAVLTIAHQAVAAGTTAHGPATAAAAGAGVVEGTGGSTGVGLLLAIGALAGEVCFSLLAVPLLPALGPLRVSAATTALAVPMLLAAGLVADGRAMFRTPTTGEALGIGYLGLVVTTVAFLLWYDALGRMGPDRAGLFAGVIPISTVAATAVVGAGAPGTAELAGALAVGAGVVIGLRPGATARRRRGDGPAVTGGTDRAYPKDGSAAPPPGGPQPGRPHTRIADV